MIAGSSDARVDVAVVTYNTRDLSVSALRRVLEVSPGVDLRLLVRDNGSADGTVEAIRQAVPEAEVEAGTENLGFARGVNRLLTMVTAPWVLLLNSDAWPERGAIEALVARAVANPRAAAIAPKLVRPDGEREHSPLAFPSLRLAIASGLVPRALIPPRAARHLLLAGAEPTPGRVDWAVGAALLLRTAALAEVGPLDDRFFFYGEDLEWCWRAGRSGWEVQYEPKAVVVHVGNASAGPVYGAGRNAVVWANTYAFLGRSYSAPRAYAIRWVNALAAALRMLSASAHGRTGLSAHWRRELRAHLRRGVPR